MPTTVALLNRPPRDPSTLTYADVSGGTEPQSVFEFSGQWLLHFAATLTDEQAHAVRMKGEGTVTTDQLRKDVLDAAPNIQLILNSTGTLTTAQLSDASRALAKAVMALGKLVLNND